MRVEKDVTVNAPIEKVYGLWTDFTNFPRFMNNIKLVTDKGGNTYHWKAKVGPIEKEWDAQVKGLVPTGGVDLAVHLGRRERGCGHPIRAWQYHRDARGH